MSTNKSESTVLPPPSTGAPTPASRSATASALKVSSTLGGSNTSVGGVGVASNIASSASTTTKKKKTTVKKAVGAGTNAKVKKPTTATGSAANNKRKKPTKKDTASAELILAEGLAAQQDLVQQRIDAAHRRSDPLWYKIEDVIAAAGGAESTMTTATNGSLPEQVAIVERALTAVGFTRSDVTPQAMACLLEQTRRFAAELIGDAADYAYTAGRPEIGKTDLLLANEMRPGGGAGEHTTTTTSSLCLQIPKLNIVAQNVNRAPLPSIPVHSYSGVVLPSAQYQLTARTFDVISTALDYKKRVQPFAISPAQKKSNQGTSNATTTTTTTTTSTNKTNLSTAGYGVVRGRQIPIQLKDRSSDGGGQMVVSTTTTQAAAAAAAAVIANDGPVPMDTSPTSSTILERKEIESVGDTQLPTVSSMNNTTSSTTVPIASDSVNETNKASNDQTEMTA